VEPFGGTGGGRPLLSEAAARPILREGKAMKSGHPTNAINRDEGGVRPFARSYGTWHRSVEVQITHETETMRSGHPPSPQVVATAGSQRSAMGWEGAVARTWQSRALGNGARNGPQAEAVAVESVPQ